MVNFSSVFVSHVVTCTVLGTAFGKLLNGPMGNMLEVRRISCLYSLLLTLYVMTLSFGQLDGQGDVGDIAL